MLALADAAAQYRWETEGTPQIARRARRKAATIFCEDEMTLATQSPGQRTWARVGQTPHCPTFGRYKGVNAFGAVSEPGGLRYRVQWDYCSQATFRAFLMTCRAATDGSLIFILDGAPYHKGDAVIDCAQEPRNERELYYLPGYKPGTEPTGTRLESVSETPHL